MPARVFLKTPEEQDGEEFLALMEASARFLRPWVYPPRDTEAYRAYVGACASPRFEGLLICRTQDRRIVGVANLSEIVRGVFQSAYLAFYVGAPFARQGYMSEGLQLVLRHAFRVMKLHRLEANIQPGNTRSQKLVRALGFQQEGYSPRYLKIGGRWRDHQRWAILRESWDGG